MKELDSLVPSRPDHFDESAGTVRHTVPGTENGMCAYVDASPSDDFPDVALPPPPTVRLTSGSPHRCTSLTCAFLCSQEYTAHLEVKVRSCVQRHPKVRTTP